MEGANAGEHGRAAGRAERMTMLMRSWGLVALRGCGPAIAQAAFAGEQGGRPLGSPGIGKASAAADHDKASAARRIHRGGGHEHGKAPLSRGFTGGRSYSAARRRDQMSASSSPSVSTRLAKIGAGNEGSSSLTER